MTHAIVPVSVLKYAAIVGSATFTIDPSIPSITTPSAIAASRSFWRRGSVIMEVTGIPFWAGYFINVRNMGTGCGHFNPSVIPAGFARYNEPARSGKNP